MNADEIEQYKHLKEGYITTDKPVSFYDWWLFVIFK